MKDLTFFPPNLIFVNIQQKGYNLILRSPINRRSKRKKKRISKCKQILYLQIVYLGDTCATTFGLYTRRSFAVIELHTVPWSPKFGPVVRPIVWSWGALWCLLLLSSKPAPAQRKPTFFIRKLTNEKFKYKSYSKFQT